MPMGGDVKIPYIAWKQMMGCFFTSGKCISTSSPFQYTFQPVGSKRIYAELGRVWVSKA
jgi:hypothetical protein